MKPKIRITSNRIARHLRIRKKVFGLPDRPRVSVFRSLKHLEAQIIDDVAAKTLVSASTRDKDFKTSLKSFGNVKAAQELGTYLGKKALAQGIKQVALDRGGYLYHGRVKAFAEALRKEGLKF